MATDEMIQASHPANVVAEAEKEKRKPKEGATAYKVRTRGVAAFRRCGITFGVDPVTVDAASMTEAQKLELLNTETLVVEEVGGADPPKADHHHHAPDHSSKAPPPATPPTASKK